MGTARRWRRARPEWDAWPRVEMRLDAAAEMRRDLQIDVRPEMRSGDLLQGQQRSTVFHRGLAADVAEQHEVQIVDELLDGRMGLGGHRLHRGSTPFVAAFGLKAFQHVERARQIESTVRGQVIVVGVHDVTILLDEALTSSA